SLLRRERTGERLWTEPPACDEHLAEPASVPLLLGERVAKVICGEELRLDEQPTERTPGRRGAGGRRLELAGRVEVDAVLLREHAREGPAAQVAVVDEDLAEGASAARLLRERALELFLGQ